MKIQKKVGGGGGGWGRVVLGGGGGKGGYERRIEVFVKFPPKNQGGSRWVLTKN